MTTLYPSRPGSILSWSRWAAVLIAILFSSWSKSHAVFSSELLNVANATAVSRGSIDFSPYISTDARPSFILSSSFVHSVLQRNQIIYLNAVPRLHFIGDVVWLPFFTESQDTGIEYYRFPFNARVGLLYNYVQNPRLVLSFGPWLGGEVVVEYRQVYWGVEHSILWKILPKLEWGMKAQAAEIEFEQGLSHLNARMETGLTFLHKKGGLALSYLLEEDMHAGIYREYHSVKTGLAFALNPRLILNAGFNYQFLTGAWHASLGMDFLGVNLFQREMFLGTALSYNLVSGISFHLSLRWDQISK